MSLMTVVASSDPDSDARYGVDRVLSRRAAEDLVKAFEDFDAVMIAGSSLAWKSPSGGSRRSIGSLASFTGLI